MRYDPALLVLVSSLAAPMTAVAQEAAPPPTERIEVRETLHGALVIDPYRWLEGSDAPELTEPDPELDARVSAWTDAQNAHTRAVLDALPGREELTRRLEALFAMGSVEAPHEHGGRYFYRERSGLEAQPVVKVRDAVDGAPRVLLDPNALDPAGLTAVEWIAPSPDGELLAFGLQVAGDEDTTLHVLRVDDGTWLADEIPNKVQPPSWFPDASGFVYRRLSEPKNPYAGIVQVHRLGRHARHDEVLFRQYEEGPLATTWGPFAYADPDARWLVLLYYTGTDSNDLWVYDLARWRETGELVRRDVLIGEDATSMGPVEGDTLYLLTTLDAPSGRVVAIDLRDPRPERWREVVPERPGVVLGSVQVAANGLVVSVAEKAVSRIELWGKEGGLDRTVELPGLGTASATLRQGSAEAFFSFESYDRPSTIYRVDLATGERRLWASPELPFDPASIRVEQVTYPSKDGTPVTMFLALPKGYEKGTPAPTVLTGYGGFAIARTPRFSTSLVPWVENGGIYAVANLRGGSEYGEDWHRAGMLDQKQNVFDDFLAAAEYLIAEGYTTKSHLGITGGSNGGLLTGAALVQRPDLFSAVVSQVPLLDMLRYQHFLMARYWVPEYGSAEDASQFGFLHAYSPYHHVKKGVEYPAVLLTAGENDSRVHPLHARKMAALLQASTGSDPEVEPVLLWVERAVGHGQGKPTSVKVREAVDVLVFLGWQLD